MVNKDFFKSSYNSPSSDIDIVNILGQMRPWFCLLKGKRVQMNLVTFTVGISFLKNQCHRTSWAPLCRMVFPKELIMVWPVTCEVLTQKQDKTWFVLGRLFINASWYPSFFLFSKLPEAVMTVGYQVLVVMDKARSYLITIVVRGGRRK